jgi:hypothetical protein
MKKIKISYTRNDDYYHLIAKYQLENLIDPSLGVEKFIRNITPDMVVDDLPFLSIKSLIKQGGLNDPHFWRLVGDFNDSFHLIYSSRIRMAYDQILYLDKENWMMHPDDEWESLETGSYGTSSAGSYGTSSAGSCGTSSAAAV